MAVLVDTKIKSTVDKKLLRAFLYGVVHGAYKLYKDMSNNKLSIQFQNEEDATVFTLKELDLEFNKKFASKDEETSSRDEDMSEVFRKLTSLKSNKYSFK